MSPSSNHIQSTTKYLKYYIIFPLNSINIFGDKIIVLHILPYFPFMSSSETANSPSREPKSETSIHVYTSIEQFLRTITARVRYKWSLFRDITIRTQDAPNPRSRCTCVSRSRKISPGA